jgi:1,4-dihydroxy-2-naphthoate octaprenyltransferase
MYERFLGIFFCGLVIKLMDDYLDQDIDSLAEKWNITMALKRGTLPYTLILMSIALYFNFSEAIGFFTASYLIGMAYEGNEKLPTNLLAWQEGLVVFIIGIMMTSITNATGCLLLIIIVQLTDDLVDYKKDHYLKRENYVIILGKVNVILIILILLMVVILYFPLKLVYFSLSVLMVYFVNYLFRVKSGLTIY